MRAKFSRTGSWPVAVRSPTSTSRVGASLRRVARRSSTKLTMSSVSINSVRKAAQLVLVSASHGDESRVGGDDLQLAVDHGDRGDRAIEHLQRSPPRLAGPAAARAIDHCAHRRIVLPFSSPFTRKSWAPAAIAQPELVVVASGEHDDRVLGARARTRSTDTNRVAVRARGRAG